MTTNEELLRAISQVGNLTARVEERTHAMAESLKRHSGRFEAIEREGKARDLAVEAASEKRDAAILEAMKETSDAVKETVGSIRSDIAELTKQVAAIKLEDAKRVSMLKGGTFVGTLIGGAFWGAVELARWYLERQTP